MRRIKVEWQPSPDKWVSQDADVMVSHLGNCYVKVSGEVYVFHELKEGMVVLGKGQDGKWIKVGRVARGSVFLGEGMPYSEYAQTPEGRKQIEEMLRGVRAWSA